MRIKEDCQPVLRPAKPLSERSQQILDDFFWAVHVSELYHLELFVRYVKAVKPLHETLKALTRNPIDMQLWKKAARYYNGSGYAARGYHRKLRSNYEKARSIQIGFVSDVKSFAETAQLGQTVKGAVSDAPEIYRGYKHTPKAYRASKLTKEMRITRGNVLTDAALSLGTNLDRAHDIKEYTAGVGYDVASGAVAHKAGVYCAIKGGLAGAKVGSVAPVVGNAVGGAIGAGVGYFACSSGVSAVAGWLKPTTFFGDDRMETGHKGCYFNQSVVKESDLKVDFLNRGPELPIRQWKTLEASGSGKVHPDRLVTASDVNQAASQLGIDPALIWAFALTESDGCGFIAHGNETMRPKVGVDWSLFSQVIRTSQESPPPLALQNTRLPDEDYELFQTIRQKCFYTAVWCTGFGLFQMRGLHLLTLSMLPRTVPVPQPKPTPVPASSSTASPTPVLQPKSNLQPSPAPIPTPSSTASPTPVLQPKFSLQPKPTPVPAPVSQS